MASSRSACSNGFVRKSTAPLRIASTDVRISPCAVTKTIEQSEFDSLSLLCSSRPVSPGIERSEITQAGATEAISAREPLIYLPVDASLRPGGQQHEATDAGGV